MTGSTITNNNPPTEEETSLLIARLQSQFGDMNLNKILGNPDDSSAAVDDDEESSLEEPSAEELARWQEAQFQKGREKLQHQKTDGREAKSARRRDLRENEAPNLPVTSAFFPAPPLLDALASADPERLGTEWRRLYSSSHGDGLSFRHLSERMRGYDGPTLWILGGEPSSSKCVGYNKDEQPQRRRRVVLGFFTTDDWMESSASFGKSNDCFLFGLDCITNDVKIVRPKSRSTSQQQLIRTRNFTYRRASKSENAVNKTDGTPYGIGGSSSRLHLTESFEECRCLPYDALFDDGDLLCGRCDSSLYYFDVDTVEVWGVGGREWIEEALAAQAEERMGRERMMEMARRVDKRQLLEHFENGVWLTGGRGLFGHQESVEGRDGDCRIRDGD